MSRTRTYHRTQSTSAPPSRANWDPDQPRVCFVCGKKLRITRDAIVMRRWPSLETYCAGCF